MTRDELKALAAELRELMRMKEELENEIAAIQDQFKAVMEEQETDTITGTDFKITWKPVTTSRIDSKALKEDLPDIARQYTKTTVYRRFCVS